MSVARTATIRRVAAASAVVAALSVGTAAQASASGGPEQAWPSLTEFVTEHVRGGSVPACRDVTIRSVGNGKFVSTELNYGRHAYAVLRARSDSAGGWEVFNVCLNGGNSTIRSTANGKFVAPELNYGRDVYAMTRARSDSAGGWESFSISLACGGGCTTIRSSANGKFVAAELNYVRDLTGMLRARSDGAGAWEQFQ
ncbi:fascin domain-containing protein [Streptoalloteichus hindustanus]|uniref:Uncharacterized protein n=1 Tax=Streptoalloteichus hindustanus TaxID=2017 RepID=A0A1M5CHJ1_STRHI|nr:hypothetical protein [Streptoalloteichus hindustanus]SHF54188.1 hypothetical protein SAMN05444320_10429 [Streptoalloteichus hindustanus]